MDKRLSGGSSRCTHGDDIAVAPGDVVAAGEEVAHRLEEPSHLRLHRCRRRSVVRAGESKEGPKEADADGSDNRLILSFGVAEDFRESTRCAWISVLCIFEAKKEIRKERTSRETGDGRQVVTVFCSGGRIFYF